MPVTLPRPPTDIPSHRVVHRYTRRSRRYPTPLSLTKDQPSPQEIPIVPETRLPTPPADLEPSAAQAYTGREHPPFDQDRPWLAPTIRVDALPPRLARGAYAAPSACYTEARPSRGESPRFANSRALHSIIRRLSFHAGGVQACRPPSEGARRLPAESSASSGHAPGWPLNRKRRHRTASHTSC